MTEKNLISLNDDHCNRVITWENRNYNSAIDFILISPKMYDKYSYMNIDEMKESIDISDHNVISAYFKIDSEKHKQYKETKVITYLKINDETKTEFIEEIEEYININNQYELIGFEQTIKKTCNDNLKRIIKRKGRSTETEEIKPTWMTQEIKKKINKRRNYSKQKRGNPQNEELENLYMEQKNKVKMLVKSVTLKKILLKK